jgi:CRP-like cAMP-binding protein
MARPRNGANAFIDRDVLHRLLWARTDSRGTIRLHQAHLAEDLGVTKFTVSRIIHEFLDAGRISKVGAAKANIATYVVEDPKTWRPPGVG